MMLWNKHMAAERVGHARARGVVMTTIIYDSWGLLSRTVSVEGPRRGHGSWRCGGLWARGWWCCWFHPRL
jgi:hypothetical protein